MNRLNDLRIDQEWVELKTFRHNLSKEEQALFDEIFEVAKRHGFAIGATYGKNPLTLILLSLVLKLTGEIKRLQPYPASFRES